MTKSNNTLPHGWNTKTLGEIGTFLKGKGIAKAEIVETGKPCIRYGQIYSVYDYFVEEFKSFINETSAKDSERIYKNDLLFAGSGETLEDIGKCVAYIKDEEAYAGGDIIILRPNSEDAHYLGYLLNNDEFKRQTYKLGQGHSVVHIYSSSLKNVKVALPPLQEQQKIAKILATWDKAILLQQQLIINKKDNKKAIMKKLLTGEVRFKGFSEEWSLVKLGKIIDVGSSKRVLEKDWKSKGVPFYRTREIINLTRKEEFRTPIYISDELFVEIKNKYGLPKTDDILVTGVGTIGEMYVVKKSDKFYFKDGNVIWFKMNNKLNSEFLFQQFQTRCIKKQLSDNASITTVSTFTIDGAKKINIKYPCIEEQQKIASFLSSIDKEINVLENELISFQKQKKGLMQQLLTGKLTVKN